MDNGDKKPVVVHAAPPSQLTEMARTAWDEYLRLRDIAERSQDVEDGVAAGRAWARFLKNFESERGARQDESR